MTDKTITVTLKLDLDDLAAQLRAVADALTAADRYAANEAKQREEAETDEAECSRCGETYPGTAEATMEHHRACTGETPENPMGDPLDESDHRDRLDADGDRWVHTSRGCWHIVPTACVGDDCPLMLTYISEVHGPLTFAPDAPQQATGDDLSAPEGESGDEERGEADNTVAPTRRPSSHGGPVTADADRTPDAPPLEASSDNQGRVHHYPTDIDRAPDGTAWSWTMVECRCDRPWRHQ